jgi:hypothetical protein
VIVAIDAGSRYKFKDFTGATNPDGKVTLNAATAVTANYDTQYKLTLATNPAAVALSNVTASPSSADGFYNAGTEVTVAATAIVAIDAGSRYKFKDFTGATNPDGKVMLNAPTTVTANYIKQFNVTFKQSGIGSDTTATVLTIGGSVNKNANELAGAGFTDWFDTGTSWSFAALVPTDPASGKRYSLTSTASGTIYAAGTITGAYGIQYRLNLATNPAAVGVANITGAGDGSWHNANVTVSLTAAAIVGIDATSRYRFTQWSGDASGTANPVNVLMNGPKTVTANYVIQYLLTFSQAGIPVSGLLTTGANPVVTVDGLASSAVVLPVVKWYDTGSIAEFNYTSPVFTSPVTSTLFLVTGVTGGTSPITVNGPATIVGTYATSVFTIQYLAPIDQTTDGSIRNEGKNGRVIPVKVRLYQDNVQLNPTTILGDVTIRVSGVTCGGTSVTTDVIETYADAGNSNGNTNLFRWASDGWIYNLDTGALRLTTNNCYRLDVFVGSGIQASYSTFAVFKPVK